MLRAPGKIIGVHVNYRSRAAQRGSTPPFPTYFFKPPTTVAASGDPVVRPRECELLVFEGEIALVMGERAHRVSLDAAWSHVGWVTAANDFGLYDLRHADHGSSARSKGIDGYTPIGPRMLEAEGIDPASLRLRSWVDGKVVQEAWTREDLLFDLRLLVADLSRLMTLEPGDVILTGTPAGAGVVEPGAVVEVEVTVEGGRAGVAAAGSTGRLVSHIVESDLAMPEVGAMPKVDDPLRALARGEPAAAPAEEDRSVRRALGSVSTATLASQLRRRGLEDCIFDGVRPTRPDARMVGRARTLRYVPFRADLFEQRGSGMNAQKRAVESLQPGEVLVIEARGVTSAGTIGDLLALRASQRGACGIVTDGAVRDVAALGALSIPTFHDGAHPAVLGRRHVPWETDVVISCAGATVQPGELVVGDGDGVVVVPEAVAGAIAHDAVEQEQEERFIALQLAKGASVAGLYPLSGEWRVAYAAWREEEAGR